MGSHNTAEPSGVSTAMTVTTTASGCSKLKLAPPMVWRSPSAPNAAAKIKPAPHTNVAGPGQGRIASVAPGGVTITMVCKIANIKPTMLKPTARASCIERSRRSNASNPATTKPAVIQTGVMPGPPGCTRNTEIGERSGSLKLCSAEPIKQRTG
ncbi:unannotated protein [freshwater metagenome]|uniref:Unannotated protein n=1 Tax=freshwater metagenome TaxID=449393 RepID=A0A6J7SR38_9ZZZZ